MDEPVQVLGMQKGILASVAASGIFACMYFLSPALAPLQGQEVFGWRIVLTIPLTTALLWLRHEWPAVRALWQRVCRQPLLVPLLLLSAFMLGIQLWLFLWAPLNGRALPVALGYFLLPLAMVLTGRLVYGERLSRAQCWATALAALGVAWEFGRTASFSWEMAVVSLGYPVYFVLRRRLGTANLAGHWLDVVLMVPVACWFVWQGLPVAELFGAHPRLYALLPLLGLLSAVSLALYMVAHRLLPLGLFGLLSYVEPVLLVVVALLLGERVQAAQWPTYGLIFAAVACLMLEGVVQVRQQMRTGRI